MRFVGFLGRLVLLFLIVSVERTIGVPILFVLLVALLSARFQGVMKYVWLFVAGLLLQALFVIPWFLSMTIIGALFVGWEYGRELLPSETARLLILGIVTSALIVYFSPGKISAAGTAYAIFILVGLLLILKRERLQPKQWRRFG